jgi:hypothetical protein
MYSVSLMVEDINKGLEGEVVSNVMVITDLQAITPEELKPVAEMLSQLACESQFMRREV